MDGDCRVWFIAQDSGELGLLGSAGSTLDGQEPGSAAPKAIEPWLARELLLGCRSDLQATRRTRVSKRSDHPGARRAAGDLRLDEDVEHFADGAFLGDGFS